MRPSEGAIAIFTIRKLQSKGGKPVKCDDGIIAMFSTVRSEHEQ